MTQPRLQHHPDGIVAIDTEYERPDLDASHLIIDDGRAAFVDTGTTHSVPLLLAALDVVGIPRDAVDYVLLTHIHLDHAGGAGELMKWLPNARCVVHPRGAPHIIDPEILIASSEAVYGEERFKRLYGHISGIPAHRVISSHDGMTLSVGKRTLTLFDTPGHALHHYCLYDHSAQCVFTGDTFGVSYRELDTDKGPFILPATTPTHFDPSALHASVDRILSFQPQACYLTHYSRVTQVNELAAVLHREIDVFVTLAHANHQQPKRVDALYEALMAHHSQRLTDHGIKNAYQVTKRVLDMDLQLDAQGLDVWLSRSGKR